MKKKINKQFLCVAVIAIVSTLVLLTGVFYNLFQKQVLEDLKTLTLVMEENDTYMEENQAVRVTLIQPDGNVIYDNEVIIESLGNHADRPEIKEALAKGEGSSIRHSDTMGISTYYYALRLSDGTILRTAKEAGSIWSIFANAIPVMIAVALFLFGICMLLAHFLTKSLITPIEKISHDMDHISEDDTYEELIPFVHTIRRQHADIMKAARMRQDFTANVSHELKTPLTSISGYSELIENGMASEDDIGHFAGEIHKNATRLLTLINDIIRLSELDVVENPVAFEKINLFNLAENCVDMLQLNAENHGVKLLLSGSSAVIYANKQMMEEVLYNLTDNAIRYNRPGGTVEVDVTEMEYNVILSVSDTGIGIPSEHQARIFERFYRVDKSRSKSLGGTGLGLAIVKHIVATHRAELELHSEENVGTTIRVIFKKKE